MVTSKNFAWPSGRLLAVFRVKIPKQGNLCRDDVSHPYARVLGIKEE